MPDVLPVTTFPIYQGLALPLSTLDCTLRGLVPVVHSLLENMSRMLEGLYRPNTLPDRQCCSTEDKK